MNAQVQTDRDSKYDELMKIGACTYSALVEMVEALECDYDRLEQLKDDRDGFDIEDEDGFAIETTPEEQKKGWAEANPDEAEELAELEKARGECESREDAEQRIQEQPLSVEVRSGWYSPGSCDDDTKAAEFCILLGTGGPATRIRGELDESLQPYRAWLEVQDWFTPWTQYQAASQETLLTYCQQFYFGE